TDLHINRLLPVYALAHAVTLKSSFFFSSATTGSQTTTILCISSHISPTPQRALRLPQASSFRFYGTSGHSDLWLLSSRLADGPRTGRFRATCVRFGHPYHPE